MNILFIPSWYPSLSEPIAGAFIKEQITTLAKNHPDINFGISSWGANDKDLLIQKADGFKKPNQTNSEKKGNY